MWRSLGVHFGVWRVLGASAGPAPCVWPAPRGDYLLSPCVAHGRISTRCCRSVRLVAGRAASSVAVRCVWSSKDCAILICVRPAGLVCVALCTVSVLHLKRESTKVMVCDEGLLFLGIFSDDRARTRADHAFQHPILPTHPLSANERHSGKSLLSFPATQPAPLRGACLLSRHRSGGA